ncbi:hypothetical protein V1478_009222 [Vespula squamosa]|uniref:Uncharacterized protein n=1 Tax=Vespula squamosa TaxID=30214 RepID=A0ABD2AP16_VESSQ
MQDIKNVSLLYLSLDCITNFLYILYLIYFVEIHIQAIDYYILFILFHNNQNYNIRLIKVVHFYNACICHFGIVIIFCKLSIK